MCVCCFGQAKIKPDLPICSFFGWDRHCNLKIVALDMDSGTSAHVNTLCCLSVLHHSSLDPF